MKAVQLSIILLTKHMCLQSINAEEQQQPLTAFGDGAAQHQPLQLPDWQRDRLRQGQRRNQWQLLHAEEAGMHFSPYSNQTLQPASHSMQQPKVQDLVFDGHYGAHQAVHQRPVRAHGNSYSEPPMPFGQQVCACQSAQYVATSCHILF